MPWTIYCHTLASDGRRYIGLTARSMKRRWNEHICHSKSTKGGRWHFPNAIRKYGKDAFTHHILGVCDSVEQANLVEEVWVFLLDTRNPEKGFNLTNGGKHIPHPIRKNPWDQPGFREARTAESRARAADPAFIARQTANSQALASDPSFAAGVSARVREAYERDPGLKDRVSSSIRDLWQNPEYRSKVVSATRAGATNPKRLEKISAAAKAIALTPEGRATRSAISQKAWADPDFRSARVAEARARAMDPEWKSRCAPKKHANAAKTHCHRGHEFTVENTKLCGGRRVCRACRRKALASSPAE